ncbi:HpcH/HpaI aldolase/citrate lyase family protein [Streptomyces fuscichromogenes]|uniref:HpcH/HpaI aldolase/citrate lyase family protein n=1 Tax=Streptomyces fuscichromogenes TaxID=1324013 RepID=UPI003817C62B
MPAAPGPVARRSCLSVPGSDLHKIGKASSSGADEIVVDLEDAVPPDAKDSAREQVAEWLSEAGTGPGGRPGAPSLPRVSVRVNAPRSPWCHTDILACAASGGPLRSLVVPKVENAGDLAFVDRLLDGAEAAAGRREPLRVQALIETATGLANLREITAASPRLEALVLGYADLSASLGRAPDAPPATWLWAQDALLVAARDAGLAAIDGPHLGVAVDGGLTAAARHAAQLGFDGKWVIHPRQIVAVHDAFTPTAQEVENAHRVLAALRTGHGQGVGALVLDGRMVDEAVAVQARRVLARSGRNSD